MYLDGANGIRIVGDGLLDVTDVTIQSLRVQATIGELYDVEQDPFAR